MPKLFVVGSVTAEGDGGSLAFDSLTRSLEVSQSRALVSQIDFLDETEGLDRYLGLELSDLSNHLKGWLPEDLILFVAQETFFSPDSLSVLIENRSDSHILKLNSLLPQAPGYLESLKFGDVGFLANFGLVQNVTGACCPRHLPTFVGRARSTLDFDSVPSEYIEQVGVYGSSVRYELDEVSTRS